jgi:hypothetical protein
MTDTSMVQTYRYEILFAGILLLSAFLNTWNIWGQGYSNAYYAAAVRSMLENPSPLFFNSFDAAGFITVDKPPVGLWVQAASAALLGFSGWSLVLPQALAGVGSVALVCLIVSRVFGKPAGLVSGREIRYFYLSGAQGGGGSNSGNSAIFSWVQSTCTAIPSSEWGDVSSASVGDRGLRSLNESQNRTSPGQQNNMPSQSGTGSSGSGSQNSLYDCAGYAG